MAKESRVFVDGIKTNDKCPNSDSGICECKGQLLDSYGFTPYGLGTHRVCEECSTVYDFSEDMG